jgi:hypothetical protein
MLAMMVSLRRLSFRKGLAARLAGFSAAAKNRFAWLVV